VKVFVEGNMVPAVTRMFPVWQKMGHSIVNSPDADVQLSIVKIRVDSDLPKVLRLDGVYYEKEIPWEDYNKPLSDAHENSDAIVYQSHTSKVFCEKYLGKRRGVYDIIYNGIDPEGWNRPLEHDGINIVSCANWRRWKRLPEIVEVFERFQERYEKNSRLHIVGSMGRGAEKIEHDDVIYHSYINHHVMRGLYHSMDLYLHLAKNDSCPSTVIEAIAAGIPIITTDICGGVTEICKFTDNCFILEGEEVSYEVNSIYGEKWNRLPDGMSEALSDLMYMAHGTRSEFPDELHINTTATKYIDLMEKVC